MKDSIPQLIERLKQKDNQAFELIYYETNKLVYSIIVSIVKDDAATEDLMQETYIKMIENINQFDPKRNFKSWLSTIARNLAIDYYRKSSHEQLIDITIEEEVYYKSDAKNLDLEHEAFELLEILTDDERIIVLLRVFDEMSFKEISKIVNRPIGTVLWSYNNSIKKMSDNYKKEVR